MSAASGKVGSTVPETPDFQKLRTPVEPRLELPGLNVVSVAQLKNKGEHSLSPMCATPMVALRN